MMMLLLLFLTKQQVIGVARTCDLILIAIDAMKPLQLKRIIEYELEGFGIRLNKKPPQITFRKKDRGGVFFSHTITPTHLDKETVEAICKEYKYSSAEVCLHEDATADQLIDVIEGNRVYIPCLYVLNKIDAVSMEELEILDRIPNSVFISAYKGWNIDELLEKLWEVISLFLSCLLVLTLCSISTWSVSTPSLEARSPTTAHPSSSARNTARWRICVNASTRTSSSR